MGGLNIDLKHSGKNIYIAFCAAGIWYLCPHDEARIFLAEGLIVNSKAWDEGGPTSRCTSKLSSKSTRYEG